MNSGRLVFWIVFVLYWCESNGAENSKEKPSADLHETCNNDDIACLTLAASDKLGLEAIRALHRQLDDDANGNIDLSETGDFLREDLKLDSGYEKRQKAFHYNDDMHISVKELWEAWLRSEVHNWTVQQTTEWLVSSVELPQYAENFQKHRVTGAHLPRLAVNNMHYLSVLGIKDPIHKQKISLKAMDVVLFGPPKESYNHWKDVIILGFLLVGALGAWYAINQNNKFRSHVNELNKSLKYLSEKKQQLEELELMNKALMETDRTINETSHKDTKETASNNLMDAEEVIVLLQDENKMLRAALDRAEGELQNRSYAAPPELQLWLQLTFAIENRNYLIKKEAADRQLQLAREACEKLKKKRSSLVGAFVSTHGKSIDDVDRSIVQARTTLMDLTSELQTRIKRWRQIEQLCGCSLMENCDIAMLEATLNCNGSGHAGNSGGTSRPYGLRGRMNSSDNLDDETSSIYAPSAAGIFKQDSSNQLDSSGSEASRHDEETNVNVPSSVDNRRNKRNGVMFQLGGDSSEHLNRPSGNRPTTSHCIKQASASSESPLKAPKSSSETSLDQVPKPGVSSAQSLSQSQSMPLAHRSIQERDEDVYSTDSSVIDEEVKKKRRKYFSFGKKSSKSKAE